MEERSPKRNYRKIKRISNTLIFFCLLNSKLKKIYITWNWGFLVYFVLFPFTEKTSSQTLLWQTKHHNWISQLIFVWIYSRRQDVQNGQNEIRDFGGEGGYMCPSSVKYARPKRARTTSGQWKYIVNAGDYTQTLRLEMCLYVICDLSLDWFFKRILTEKNNKIVFI